MPIMRQIGSPASGGSCRPLSCQNISECNETKQAPAVALSQRRHSLRGNPSEPLPSAQMGGTERGLVTQRTGFVPVLPLVMTRRTS